MTADKSTAAWHPGDGPVEPLDLDAIRARADAAAPGPWVVNEMGELRAPSPDNGIMLSRAWARGPDGPEAQFIAHAREDIPALLAALAVETARANQARAVVAEMSDDPDYPLEAMWKARLMIALYAAPTTGQ